LLGKSPRIAIVIDQVLAVLKMGTIRLAPLARKILSAMDLLAAQKVSKKSSSPAQLRYYGGPKSPMWRVQ
jgi:hypothetical protein